MCVGRYLHCILIVLISYKYFVNASGTTKYLKYVFIGRCYEYQSLARQNKLDNLNINLNCTHVWDIFYNAFAFKDSCNVTREDFQPLFDLIGSNKKINNALFWSGAHLLVSSFRSINDDYIALEDTFPGYLFDNLNWCGSPTSKDGLNDSECSGPCNPVNHVWFLASLKFASRATGVAHVLLNASRDGGKPAYYKDSTFRSVEMPRINVQKLIVYLATDVGTQIRENCQSNSIDELRADAEKKGIAVECVDQPKLVLRIYCIRYPQATQCVSTSHVKNNIDNKLEDARNWQIVAITLSAFCCLLLIGFVIWRLHKLFCRKSMLSSIVPSVQENNNAIVLHIETTERDKSIEKEL